MMKIRNGAFLLGTLLLASIGRASAQDFPVPLPSQMEKELAARASNVTEVTLGKNMLGFAAKFMSGNDQDDAATRKLIENLQGIYVREYEFDKEGAYSVEQVEQIRKQFETSEWSPIVHERQSRNHETTDVMFKMVNGQSNGMFVLESEPKELTIVLILGPIRMDDLGRLKGLGGLGALGDVQKDVKSKDK